MDLVATEPNRKIYDTVTVAVPVLNESVNIENCLNSILAQDYERIQEIIVVDGGSTDGTIQIVERYCQVDSRIQLIHNPKKYQTFALNLALSIAKGSIFARVDGHCVIESDYISNGVKALNSSHASVVGGSIHPIGRTWIEKGISAAMESRFGSGAASFHRADSPCGFVDTVYLGLFRTDDLKKVGGYDETFYVNEDAELNFRLSKLSGVYFDNTIKSNYRPRGSLRALAKQYFRYGQFRAKTVLKHPKSIAWRQLAAPFLILGVISPKRKKVITAYIGVTVLGSLQLVNKRPSDITGFLLVLPIMHFSWGIGFIVGLTSQLLRRNFMFIV
jgi:glycosyltransferase involved in cell wall biosynthesis